MDNEDLKDDISEIRADVKQLLIDVGILKYKSSFFGMIGGMIVLLAAFITRRFFNG